MNLTAAQQLAQWLESTHPALYAAVRQRAATIKQTSTLRRATLRGFGDDSGGFDFSLPDISSDVSTSVVPDTAFDTAVTDQYSAAAPIDISTVSASDLSPVSSPISLPDVASSISTTTDSGGFLNSIGSGIASAASSVGSFLTSSQGLNDLAKLGTAYFQLQNNKTNAQLQTAVLNAQVARIAAGGSPLPITYARAPDGSMVPVYASSALASQGVFPANMPVGLQAAITAGQSQLVTLPDGATGYTVPSNIVGGLSVSTSSIWPWVLLLGLGLILARG